MNLLIFCLTICIGLTAYSEESLSLPDPLHLNGKKITTSKEWKEIGRPLTLELFRKHMYGRRPVQKPKGLSFAVTGIVKDAMDGKATRKLVKIDFEGPNGKGTINAIIFIPNNAPKPAPGYTLICHRKPENIDPDRKIKMPFWPAEEIIKRGYVAATFHVQDVDPDKHDQFKNGVHGIFDPEKRADDAWGTISAWGWGASRLMDYFELDPKIDHKKIAVVGHSRGGKAALWCGAEDERFAMVVSNNSGCTGAALARRKKGERVARINDRFKHWFCENYNNFNGKEEELPVDQHQLLALIAPRLVYVSSASKDAWADPEGEFLSCYHAEPVYKLFGLKGVGADQMPKINQPLNTGSIAYHLREGKHNMNEYDWKCFMDFSDRHWKTTDKK